MIAPKRKGRAWKCLLSVGIMVVFPSLSAFVRAVANEGASAVQFINQAFAYILPEKYKAINREQDLGKEGLRQAKESYDTVGFVKKNKVRSQEYIIK